MGKVTVVNENVTFEVEDGERLLPFFKEHTAMLFGCEKGRCGICICTVLKGMENLNEKSQQEIAFLHSKNAYPGQRLACLLRIKHGEVEIEY
ncbi:(2Fe-2S)-binding protein [Candidatus Micrarchaeota archaeon]|nr:(2Fe-2S)-binding protein [Candidatus Micrarchaeota archaeon]